VTSHGFILLTCGPGTAMLVPQAPQYESGKNHRQTNPNIGSHHSNTIFLIIAQPCEGCSWPHFKKGDATHTLDGCDGNE